MTGFLAWFKGSEKQHDLQETSEVVSEDVEVTPKDAIVDEETPLITSTDSSSISSGTSSISSTSFFWIELALFSNVFLAGFDGTVTATTYSVIGSEFHASNTVSWITTSYLLSSTAVQPLYGRFSDIFGRRSCFLCASMTFALGCLGCGLSKDIITLNTMRALTGIGGGGLTTMSTIINSDIISAKNRGMFQALQNVLMALGAISGASLGGAIADLIGWRWCFLLQVPVAIQAIVVGYMAIKANAPSSHSPSPSRSTSPHSPRGARRPSVAEEIVSVWTRVDICGSLLLVLGLASQLGALSMGGNEYAWTSAPVLGLFGVSVLLLFAFGVVECRTSAVPIIPMQLFRGLPSLGVTVANLCTGLSSYGFLFTMPLFFQAILLDRPSQAGLRMIVPSLMTPVGGITMGLMMARNGSLRASIWVGLGLFCLGYGSLLTLGRSNPSWEYIVFLLPAGFGQGLAMPSLLFSAIRMAEPGEHAVATSVTYLTRSVGAVWGVALTSAIIQNTVASLLPEVLRGVAGYEEIVEDLLHSIYTLHELDPDIRGLAQGAYFEAIRKAFVFIEVVAVVGFVASFLIKSKRASQ